MKSAMLFNDSKSAISIAHNPILFEQTKHIEIDCYFVCDYVSKGSIKTKYIKTQDQVVDVLMKPLGQRQFLHLLSKMGVLNLTVPEWHPTV